MSFIQQFFTSRDNNANAETFVGQEGRLWWDPVTNKIYYSDGSTPGGIPVTSGGGGNGSPGGSNSQVQFNSNGDFGGSANLTFNVTNGALTAVSFAGDGSALTNITGANVVGSVANATYADSAGTAVTVTASAQPNITSVGTLTSVTTTGNVTASGLYIGGNGVFTGNLQVQGNLTYNNITNLTTSNLVFGLANTSVGVSANGGGFVVGNTNEASFLYNFGTQQWNSNIGISAGGNIIGTNLLTPGLVSATGNVTGGNIRTAGVVSATGNVTGAYFIGNGSQLTGIVSSYGNSNVTLLLSAGISNNISTTGTVVAGNLNVTTAGNNLSVGHVQIYVANNTITTDNGSAVQFGVRINTANIFATGIVTATGNVSGGNLTTPGQVSSVGNITTLGNISGNYYIGNGSLLTGIVTNYSNANVAAYLPTYTGNLVALTGNIITTANVSGNYILGNGAFLTGINSSTYGNSNVVTLLSGFGSNVISTTGNISGNYFIGNGSQLTGLPATYGNANVAANLAAFGSNPISTSGNVTSGNLLTSGIISATGRTFVASGNVSAPGITFSADTAQDTGLYWISDGNIGVTTNGGIRAQFFDTGFSVFGNVTSGNLNATGLSLSGNVVSAINTTANITTTANISGNYILGNGSQLTGIVSSYGNSNVAAYLPTYTGNLVALTGNVTTTANVSGNYILGNGSQLTGIVSSYGNSNVAAYLASGTDTSNITTTANVSGGNLLTSGIISATGRTFVASGNAAAPGITFSSDIAQDTGLTLVSDGNMGFVTNGGVRAQVFDVGFSVVGNSISGNFLTAGLVSATGNVTGNFFIGNGSQLTGIVSSYGNANVVANLAALGSNPVSTTGNVTAGYFIGNGYTLTSVNASNVSGTVASATTAGTVTTNAQPNITSVGTLTSLSSTGNVAGNNLLTAGSASAAGNVTGGNILTGGLISATANITGSNLNATGLSLSGNVVSAINTTANITTTANVAGNYFIGNGSQLTGITVTTTYANANVAAYLASGTDTSNIITTANVSGSSILGNLVGATATLTGNITASNVSATGTVTGANLFATGFISASGRVLAGNGVVTSPGLAFGADIGADTGYYLISDGNIGVSTNGVLRASFFDTGFSVVSNITGGNISTANTLTGGTVNVTTLLSSAGNVIAANVRTTGLVTATGNVVAGNIVTTGLITATGNIQVGNVLTGGVVSAVGNVTGGNINAINDVSAIGNIRTIGLVSAFGTIRSAGGADATGFAVGNSAVSNVALGFFPTAGTPAEMAIRDYSTVAGSMYFDVTAGNTSTNGAFQFRGSSAYTQWAKIDQYGLTLPTRPAFRVYGAGTTNISATNTLTGNNFAVDYNQGSYLNTTTGVFTAPVPGLYQINMVARYGGSASTSSILVRKTSGGVDTTQVYLEWGGSSSAFHFGGASVTKLAVGDTLKMVVTSGTVTFDVNDSWSVAFIG